MERVSKVNKNSPWFVPMHEEEGPQEDEEEYEKKMS